MGELSGVGSEARVAQRLGPSSLIDSNIPFLKPPIHRLKIMNSW
jgi:hypothetical protein